MNDSNWGGISKYVDSAEKEGSGSGKPAPDCQYSNQEKTALFRDLDANTFTNDPRDKFASDEKLSFSNECPFSEFQIEKDLNRRMFLVLLTPEGKFYFSQSTAEEFQGLGLIPECLTSSQETKLAINPNSQQSFISRDNSLDFLISATSLRGQVKDSMQVNKEAFIRDTRGNDDFDGRSNAEFDSEKDPFKSVAAKTESSRISTYDSFGNSAAIKEDLTNLNGSSGHLTNRKEAIEAIEYLLTKMKICQEDFILIMNILSKSLVDSASMPTSDEGCNMDNDDYEWTEQSLDDFEQSSSDSNAPATKRNGLPANEKAYKIIKSVFPNYTETYYTAVLSLPKRSHEPGQKTWAGAHRDHITASRRDVKRWQVLLEKLLRARLVSIVRKRALRKFDRHIEP